MMVQWFNGNNSDVGVWREGLHPVSTAPTRFGQMSTLFIDSCIQYIGIQYYAVITSSEVGLAAAC